MPYTASYTFSGSTVISATNAQSNLTDMKEYINGGVSSSDLRTSDKWVESSHLVHGSYNPINNTMNFMSGVSGTNLAADGTESWMLDSPTARDDPATPVKVDYPDTGATFYLERAADVLVRFHASATSSFDGDASGVIRAYLAFDGNLVTNSYMAARPSTDTAKPLKRIIRCQRPELVPVVELLSERRRISRLAPCSVDWIYNNQTSDFAKLGHDHRGVLPMRGSYGRG
jgi:hypothetical protein